MNSIKIIVLLIIVLNISDAIPNLTKEISNSKIHFHGFDSLHFDGQIFNPFQYRLDHMFDRFMKKFDKKYTQEERAQRREYLRKSIESIAKFINDSSVRKSTFQVGLNWLSDRSPEEIRKMLGYKQIFSRNINVSDRIKRSSIRDAVCQPKNESVLPESFDWRSQNIVTPVKDQQECGCCWAFAATAVIESQWAKKTKKMIDLSEQDFVNCASTHGCDGESEQIAYKFSILNGQGKEESAPYIAKVGQCKHYPIVNGVQISDFCSKGGVTTWSRTTTYSNGTKVVTHWNETENNPDSKIMRDIYEIGPVVASINATTLHEYVSGIYDIPDCSTETNHAITLVGWGSQEGVDFWIVKNSWGSTWGENGYFRIVRGKNMCGINQVYSYPIIKNYTPFNRVKQIINAYV